MSFDGLTSLHPALLAVMAATLFVNAVLVVHLVRRWTHYREARHWPRLTVRADSVNLMRVVHTYVNQLPQRQYHQAVLSFRYVVNGREYAKQSIREVGSAEEAEALKGRASLSFIYNPEKPEETLEQIPGAVPVVVTLLGLLIANSMLIGLAHSLTVFLGGGAE
ncbi:MAG: hypothetical protein ACREUW_10995 [Burkholderiales bacterium]